MSENISSSVLFHFTSSLANLKSILENGFYPRYCPEYSYGSKQGHAASKNLPPLTAVPMVCFCDLPLALIKFHLKAYGEFGIGLTKEWGIRNGLSPVFYIHEQSLLFQLLPSRIRAYDRDLRLLFAYTKPIDGPAWRKGKTQHSIKFYDEREWRFVPRLKDAAQLQLPREDYSDVLKLEALHQSLKEKFKLTIYPIDIQYLILPESKDEHEIVDFVEFLNKLYSPRDAILVTTTIMTTGCIINDI